MQSKRILYSLLPWALAFAVSACGPGVEICDNGVDDDEDAAIDCDDADCGADPACELAEVCDNGADDDGDAQIDCDDADCAAAPNCQLGLTGDACEVGTDCADAECLDEPVTGFPAGYCAATCDPANGDADCTGGVCVPLQGGGGLCFDDCDLAQGGADCRDGYQCLDAFGDGSLGVCFPGCDNDAQCPATGNCEELPGDPNEGFCVVPEICDNGVDEDADGQIDCADANCAADPVCLQQIDDACAAAVVANLGDNLGNNDPAANANAVNLFNDLLCPFESPGPEELFVFTPAADGDIDITVTPDVGSGGDPVLYARTTCNDANSTLACEDAGLEDDPEAILIAGVTGQAVTIFVDSFVPGPYTLTINQVVCGDGSIDGAEECDDQNTAAGDGCDAVCVVEDGFSCNGEPSNCVALAGLCALATPILANVPATGDNTGQDDNFTGSCQIGGAGEDLFTFLPIADGDLTLTLNSATDQGVYVRADCVDENSELGCVDAVAGGTDEVLTVGVQSGVAVTIFVDGFNVGEEGPYTLTAAFTAAVCGNGTLEGAETCDDQNTAAGDGCDAVCQEEAGFACNGEPSVCVDLSGFCAAAVVVNAGDTINDDTTGAADNFTGSCQLGGAGEDLFTFTAAADGTLTLTLTSDVDLGVYARSTCEDETSELGCADVDFGAGGVETLDVALLANDSVTLFVDGFDAAGVGPYILQVAFN